jgi:hypothetical protein
MSATVRAIQFGARPSEKGPGKGRRDHPGHPALGRTSAA